MNPKTGTENKTPEEKLLGGIALFAMGFFIAMTMCLLGH